MKVNAKVIKAVKPVAPQGNVMCLDVALRNTGLAVYSMRERRFIFSEVICTDKEEGLVAFSDINACSYLAASIFLRVRSFNVKVVIAEMPTGGAQGARANRAMGLATGVAASVTALVRTLNGGAFKFIPVLPSDTKRLYADTGAVSKEDMQRMVEKKFGDVLPKQKGKREHIADAMATLLFVQRYAPSYLVIT